MIVQHKYQKVYLVV